MPSELARRLYQILTYEGKGIWVGENGGEACVNRIATDRCSYDKQPPDNYPGFFYPSRFEISCITAFAACGVGISWRRAYRDSRL